MASDMAQPANGAAQHVRAQLAEQVNKFRQFHGFTPQLDNPRRFSEKVFRRILFERDPYYLQYANKLFSRGFVSQRHVPNLKIARLLKVVNALRPADFADLPARFAIKSAFGSGLNQIVADKQSLDITALCDTFNAELFKKRNAQGYSYPYNCFLFEAYIGDDLGNSPSDYKFHCFRTASGDYKSVIQFDRDRFSGHKRSFFDETFKLLPFTIGPHPSAGSTTAPGNLDEMLHAAKKIAAGFDYIRVDLYSIRNEIYFGEITPFHGGGKERVSSEAWDLTLGDMWTQVSPYYSPPLD